MNLDKSATQAVSADRKIRLFAAGELCLLQRRRGTAEPGSRKCARAFLGFGRGAVDEEDIIYPNIIQKQQTWVGSDLNEPTPKIKL